MCNRPRSFSVQYNRTDKLTEQPLVPGRAYWLKHAGRRTSAKVETVRYRVDVNTLHRVAAAALKLNEIGRRQLRTHEPLRISRETTPKAKARHTGEARFVRRSSQVSIGRPFPVRLSGATIHETWFV